MGHRFSPGDTVYAKDGRSYIVEAVDGRTVYCTAPNGVETEFPEDRLFAATEWSARDAQTGRGKREISYQRLRQSRRYLPGPVKIEPTAAERMLARVNVLFPSLIDFVAFTTAALILDEHKEGELIDQLSIIKSRAVFDDTPPAVRACVLAEFVRTQPEALVGAAGLGDNLLRAIIEKGLAVHAQAYDEFQDRPRK
ncbi:MAG: hypothetical protein AB7E79_16785 [Rhodospirillaceae bacterium]